MKQQDTVQFFEILQTMYPNAKTELVYETPFQLLMAVVLSAQTTDKQVNKVTAQFFATLRGPQDIIAMGQEQLTQLLSSINYYKNKAKHLYHTAQTLVSEDFLQEMKKNCRLDAAQAMYDDYGYYIPDTIEGLVVLQGVGEKTAKVVLQVLYDLPFIGVDTHVHRVANRIGLVATKTPAKTSEIIEGLVPTYYLAGANQRFVFFGRYHCQAKKPLCASCKCKVFCKFYKKNGL